MSTKKDFRRVNLAVPYQAPKASSDVDAASTMSSVMPMAAMMTRNRYVGWGSVVYSTLAWLGESEDQRKTSGTPGYFSVGMSAMALVVTYIPIFMPPPGGKVAPAAAVPVA